MSKLEASLLRLLYEGPFLGRRTSYNAAAAAAALGADEQEVGSLLRRLERLRHVQNDSEGEPDDYVLRFGAGVDAAEASGGVDPQVIADNQDERWLILLHLHDHPGPQPRGALDALRQRPGTIDANLRHLVAREWVLAWEEDPRYEYELTAAGKEHLLQHPWVRRWRRVPAPARGGGQGLIAKVVDRTSGEAGALKVIRPEQQRDTTRRKRMAEEALALDLLAGIAGVPQLLDHNARAYEDVDVPLYMVLRWIDGDDLGSLPAKQRTLSIADDLALMEPLVVTVGECHGRSVVHRDIKPENVILSQGRLHLVDFGIAWRADRELDVKTAAAEELGNRFLRLPELAAVSALDRDLKRDVRSDVTFLVGLLFYLLTGRAPRQMQDAQGRKPHEAFPPATSVQADARWRPVKRIFDVGFCYGLADRFQDAEELLERIRSAGSPEPPVDDLGHELELLQDAVSRSGFQARRERRDLLRDVTGYYEVQLTGFGAKKVFIAELQHEYVDAESKFHAAWRVSPDGSFAPPTVKLWHAATLVEGSALRLRLAAGVFGGTSEGTEYWEGPASDRDGAFRAALVQARRVMKEAIITMRAQLDARLPQAAEEPSADDPSPLEAKLP